MLKYKIIFCIDILFFVFVGFILSLPFINYFLAMPYNLICAFFIGIILSIILGKVLLNKHKKENIKAKNTLQYKTSLLNINLMDKNQLFSFISSYLTKKKVHFVENRTFFEIRDRKICLFIKFGFSSVEKVDILRYYNSILEGYTAVVISEKFDDDIVAFAKRFNKFRLVDFATFYSELVALDIYPKTNYILLDEGKKKTDFSSLLKKKNAKSFFTFGITMMFLSYFVQIKIYYLVFGSLFLIYFTLLILFGAKEEKA